MDFFNWLVCEINDKIFNYKHKQAYACPIQTQNIKKVYRKVNDYLG